MMTADNGAVYNKRGKVVAAPVRPPEETTFSELDTRFDRTRDLLGSEEWAAVHFQLLKVFGTDNVLSLSAEGISGSGQIAFGRSGRRRIDATFALSGSRVKFHQYHGIYHQLQPGHDPECRRFDGVNAVTLDAETISNDSFCRRLCDKLNQADVGIDFAYETSTQCDLFCGNALPGVPWEESAGCGHDLRRWLTKHFPDDWVGQIKLKKKMTEVELMTMIASDDCPYGGFVMLRGGKETTDDPPSRELGLCHQSSTVSGPELGPLNHILAGRLSGGEDTAQAYLDKKGSIRRTMTRRSFPDDGSVHAMSFEMFRFLRRRRGFANARLVHVVWYHTRAYIAPLLERLFTLRYKCTLEGRGGSLESLMYKLIGNGGIFG